MVQYDFVDVFLRSLIDFKLAAMMKATQGLALAEDDAEQEDEVKTQASLEGNKREEPSEEEEAKQGESPERTGISLPSTPIIERHGRRSEDDTTQVPDPGP